MCCCSLAARPSARARADAKGYVVSFISPPRAEVIPKDTAAVYYTHTSVRPAEISAAAEFHAVAVDKAITAASALLIVLTTSISRWFVYSIKFSTSGPLQWALLHARYSFQSTWISKPTMSS